MHRSREENKRFEDAIFLALHQIERFLDVSEGKPVSRRGAGVDSP